MKKRLLLVAIILIPLLFIILSLLGLVKFLGITYNSNWSLLLFLCILFIVEIVVENIVELFPVNQDVFYWLLIKNICSLFIVDSLMASIEIPVLTLIALSIILTGIETILDLKYSD